MDIDDIRPGAVVILNRDMEVRYPHVGNKIGTLPRWTRGRIVPIIPRHEADDPDILMIAVQYDVGATYWTPADYLDRSAIQ